MPGVQDPPSQRKASPRCPQVAQERRAQEQLKTRDRELTEAFEQQTATSEILQVISASPTLLQPMLNAIATNAARVCGAYDATVVLREGDLTHRVAHYGPIAADYGVLRPLNAGYVANRAILERQPVHVHDILNTERRDLAEAQEAARTPDTGRFCRCRCCVRTTRSAR